MSGARTLRADAELNRAKLLEAGRVALVTHGVDVDVRRIAQLANVGMGTFYRNFASKDELVDLIVEQIMAEFEALVDRTLAIGDTREAFQQFLSGLWRFGNRYGHSHDLRERVSTASRNRRSWDRVDELLNRAYREGVLDPVFPPSFVMLLFRGVLMANFMDSDVPDETRFELSSRFFLHGIGPATS